MPPVKSLIYFGRDLPIECQARFGDDFDADAAYEIHPVSRYGERDPHILIKGKELTFCFSRPNPDVGMCAKE